MIANYWLLVLTLQKSVEREIAEGKILLCLVVAGKEVLLVSVSRRFDVE